MKKQPRHFRFKKSKRADKALDLPQKQKRINNADLPAGSPMYYYCKMPGCEKLAAVLPESHVERPPQYCDRCQALVDRGLTL